MDTVFGPGTAAARPFRIDGNRAYGPGVSDEKGGIVLGLQAIKLLKDLGYENYAKITWLLNPDEEKGSFGSRDLIKKTAAEHDYTLCLEPGVPGDAINPWRKGIGYYILTVKGRSAHAGIEPEAGRNAAMEAAFQILQLANLGDPKKMTTLNWTLIKSGDRTNVIPDLAIAQADVRVLYADEYDRLEKDINRIIQKKLIPDTTVTLEARKGRPPFAKNAKSDALAAKLQGIYAELDMKLGSVGSGGGSDANYAASIGATAIDGLGIVGGGDHTPEEYIELNSIVPRLYLLTRTLMDLGAGK